MPQPNPTTFNPNDPKHLVNVSGKGKFITYVGLQARLADQSKGYHRKFNGGFLQNGDDHDSGRWVMRMTMTVKHFPSGECATIQAIGDASAKNVGKMIEPHLPRMAETRAAVRALRVATRSEYTSVEEVGD